MCVGMGVRVDKVILVNGVYICSCKRSLSSVLKLVGRFS